MALLLTPWYSWLLSALLLSSASCLKAGAAEITKLTEPGLVDVCDNATVSCTAQPVDATVWWTKDGNNVSARFVVSRETKDKSVVSHLIVECAKPADQGAYTCHVSGGKQKTVQLRVRAAPELISHGGATVQVGETATVICSYRASPPPDIAWSGGGKRPIKNNTDKYSISVRNVSETEVESQLTISNVSAKDDGKFTCTATNDGGRAEHTVTVTVQKAPEVKITKAVAVGKTRIFINWTVDDGNSPIKRYKLQYMKVGSDEWRYPSQAVPANATAFVLTGLERNAGYRLRLVAENAVGESAASEYGELGALITQDEDPEYKPSLSVKAATSDSLTLSWSPPPPEVASHIQSYRLMRVDPGDNSKVKELVVLHPTTVHMWSGLQPGRTYTISVRACNDLVNLCGPWSDGVEGTTMADSLVKPRRLLLTCRLHRRQRSSGFVQAVWQRPENAAQLDGYTVTVRGESQYLGRDGSRDIMEFGPETKTVSADILTTAFQVPPNTNYTVHVCAGVRESACSGGSDAAVERCSVGPGLPSSEHLQPYHWWRIRQNDRWMLVVKVDRVPERNGPICCYRIVVVRLEPEQKIESLPHPSNLTIQSFEEVEAQGYGAYIADAFQQSSPRTQYVTLGDGDVSESGCRQCQSRAGTLARLARRQAPTPAAAAAAAPFDGPLQEDATYTGFVQFDVRQRDGSLAAAHTSYMEPQTPAPSDAQEERQVLGTVLGIVSVLVFCMLVLLITLVVLRRYGKDVAVSRAIRQMLGSVRGQTVAGSSVPDLPPIARHELVAAYQERHRDSGLGFRREFEWLPQRLHDRTTYASEALENFKKNRYPDIRAYDQTRVKLSQINGVQSTEYINANFVWGYKERKKFICAQGPLEATVDDFWRMVWEHCCELMIMLTNLEEVGRTKCAKYWPEEGETTYGAITVSLAEEKPYSDYIQRVLSISRPRADGSIETRRITHMHYLVWKDFMAPEYPTGILRFIKRINEMYTLEMGPILVHCSAGVGRTGTLVAIDSLLQQMEEEGEVTIFNTICDLRHQRNYLVQSLKQYIFVYRALMEYAQFGDTEVAGSKLAATYRALCGKEGERPRTRLEDEFRRLGEVIEERKAFTVGSSDENKEKNRLDYIVPYDVNRVILAPLPTRPLDTYINASFIQGYDISESFIITQEPLERTRADFWRMVLDLEISTIVMLSPGAGSPAVADASEAADGEPPASSEPYWPDLDQTVTHDHITVKCSSVKEVKDAYTWRTFNVTSSRPGNDSVTTSHLHLVGWPPAPGDTQRTVKALIQLISRLDEVQEACLNPGPAAVHDSDGGSGSGVVVALAILVHQFTRERRVDVFQTVRRLRSQRQGMVQELAHYDLLYRAMVEYAAMSEAHGNGHT